ncbi:MAG TPA: hypothetical protein ACFYD7_12670 [Candidatus Wujingus californicus]|uniref:hypothetical protein n=1 Tax=Candidatus Wujingus californicus TaxID=3367618 RepID=UPI004029EE0E
MTKTLKDTPKNTPEEKHTLTLNEFGALLVESKETNLKKAEGKFLEVLKAKAVRGNRSSQDKKKIAELYRKSKENFLENYLIKFDVKILKQIKEFEYDRFILIVGEDVELAEGVATCIYCMYKEVFEPTEHTLSVKNGEYTSREISFCKHSYVGWDEAEIKKHLFSSKNPLTNRFKNGDILFLRGINSQSILDGLVDVSRKLYNYGILIINVTRTNDLPQEFLAKAKIIYLGTDISFDENILTITVNGKKYTDLQDTEYKLFKLLYDNKGKFVNYPEIKTKMVCSGISHQQIYNTIGSLKNKFKEYVAIENKRGVGYMMTI